MHNVFNSINKYYVRDDINIYLCNYACERMFIYSWHTSWNFFFFLSFLRKIKTKVCFRWSKTEIKCDDDMAEIELFLLRIFISPRLKETYLLFNLIINILVFINFFACWVDQEIFNQWCINCTKKNIFHNFCNYSYLVSGSFSSCFHNWLICFSILSFSSILLIDLYTLCLF